MNAVLNAYAAVESDLVRQFSVLGQMEMVLTSETNKGSRLPKGSTPTAQRSEQLIDHAKKQLAYSQIYGEGNGIYRLDDCLYHVIVDAILK